LYAELSTLTLTLWWFSPGIPDSSINKTDSRNITEILLKVALSIIILTLQFEEKEHFITV
jgi:hypothetical protein